MPAARVIQQTVYSGSSLPVDWVSKTCTTKNLVQSLSPGLSRFHSHKKFRKKFTIVGCLG